MSNISGNGWQKWALGIAVGTILGGGFAGFVGKAYTDSVEQRLNEKITELKMDANQDQINQINVASALATLTAEVKGLREDIQELKADNR